MLHRFRMILLSSPAPSPTPGSSFLACSVVWPLLSPQTGVLPLLQDDASASSLGSCSPFPFLDTRMPAHICAMVEIGVASRCPA
ncbi:hypothetical protein BU25DRAFT_135736 [Macroventuria anomochaeta]|uniref:Uncharacterized protein n=1 Tax=Macroventuria anomochaeta TaxID=301207 RepID=A0ACB6SD48_9PLEO|nr:uncharacterized protein BU25DRAFT_135736 [Macroventuria anomochaeta]KAF2631903.1 hypothetical protein BU25DRAFT_135736 [Macroventuria anomochaeta]